MQDIKMQEIKQWMREKQARNIVDILNSRHYEAYYAANKEEAVKKVLELIPEGSVIGLGGSVTLNELGLVDIFRNGNYRLIDRYAVKGYEAHVEKYREALLSDYFVTGVNAITKQGYLVNIDCSGNKNAAIMFGPKYVIIVAGVNKIVENMDEALARIRRIAPMNCVKQKHKTPCAETGFCEDCDIPARMCNNLGVIFHGMKHPGRFKIIIIPEDLGF